MDPHIYANGLGVSTLGLALLNSASVGPTNLVFLLHFVLRGKDLCAPIFHLYY